MSIKKQNVTSTCDISHCITGPLDSLMDRIQEEMKYHIEKYEYILVPSDPVLVENEYYGYDGGFELRVRYTREETDDECDHRIKAEEQARKIRKELDEKREKQELQQLKKLAKKYNKKLV